MMAIEEHRLEGLKKCLFRKQHLHQSYVDEINQLLDDNYSELLYVEELQTH